MNSKWRAVKWKGIPVEVLVLFVQLQFFFGLGEKSTFFNGVFLNKIGSVLPSAVNTFNVKYQLSEKVIFLAAYNEDLVWAQRAVEQIGVQFVVYQSKDITAPNFVPNVGSEACKYAKIFTDYYGTFPQNAIFLHAHEIGSHNGPYRNMSQIDVIKEWMQYGHNERWRSAPSTKRYHVRMRPLIKHLLLLEIIAHSPITFGEDPLIANVVRTSTDATTAKVVWKDKFPVKWPYRTLPIEYYTARNAQFATTSAAVKNHPKKLWDFAYKLCISRLSEDGTDPARNTKKKNKKKTGKYQGRVGYRIGAQFETFWKHLLAPGCDARESYICP